MIGSLVGTLMDVAEDLAEVGEAVGVVPPGTSDLIDAVDDVLEDVCDWGGIDYD